MARRFGSFFTTFAVMAVNLILAVVVAEGAAAWALKRLQNAKPAYMLTYSPEEIRALYETDDWEPVREMVAEIWRMSDTTYSPFTEFRMTPYTGKYVTIHEDGYRLNKLAPQDLARPGPKVFVFGGSTTFGSGVADDQTIPAGIERALKAAGRFDVQVFNFGAVSYFSTQERIALERQLTAGVKPDVAVFVDGLNDFYYCTIPDRGAWYDRLTQLTMARSRMPLGVEIAERSNVVRLARALGGDRGATSREWGSYCNGDDEVAKVAHRLDTNRRMIDAIAERLGFQAVFVQQPVPTYAYDNATRPVPVKDEMLGQHINAKRGYPLMAAMKDDGRLYTRNLLWLAELQAPGNAYVDTVHYSPRFNDRIGAAIAEAVLARLP